MKIGIILMFIGFFLIRSQMENLITDIIPGNLEFIIGIALIGYGLWRLRKL